MIKQKVFINRILNMKKMKMIGLDMDYTLVRYHVKHVEALVYRYTLDKLVKSRGYPEKIKSLRFSEEDAIRGLVVDCENGNILKLSRFGAIRQSYHGTKPISYSEQQEMYRTIYVDLGHPNYMAVDTSFSIAFCVLYGQLVDLKDKQPEDLPSYPTIAQDLKICIDEVHAEGAMKQEILDNFEQYVIQDKAVVDGIKRYRHYGKQFFILTNSDYFYTDALLSYAIDPFLKDGERWYDLFEYVITNACKPRFFYEERRFLKINPDTGCMTNLEGKITPGIYQSGYAQKFTDDLGVKGDEILYIGDHIYGDILRLKKDCNWRTALVVEELGDEIESQMKALPIEKQIVEAMHLKMNLEHQYVQLCSARIEANEECPDSDEDNAVQEKIAVLDEKIAKLLEQQHSFYNKRWDRVFRAGAEESYFAYQVDRFACIYMEKLADLFEHSPITYFRAHRRLLAHDVDVNELRES